MKSLNRKQKLILNSITSIFYQVIAVVCGFILPRYILEYFGSNVNGLISSITQFLGVIALMELGIGAVVRTSLYKPLSQGDNKTVSKIIKSAKRFFNMIGFIYIIYLIILLAINPWDGNGYNWEFVGSLAFIIALSSIVQYFFGVTFQLLLISDQKTFIVKIISIGTIIANTVVSVLLIKGGASIHLVKASVALIFLIRTALLNIYVRKNYKIDKHIIFEGEPIKQKWNGVAQHVAAYVLLNTDIIVLTIFTDLAIVSIYSIYNLITTGLRQFIVSTIGGIQSYFGNLLARNEYETLNIRFKQFEWIMHSIVTIVFISCSLLIVPFVQIYTAGISDANYNQPVFGFLISIAIAVYCIRLPYNTLILSAGHFKQTQTSAIVEVIINLGVSVLLVNFLGLIGVVIGTIASMLFRTIYLAVYISSNIIEYDLKNFFKHIFVDVIVSLLILLICSNFIIVDLSYISWVWLAIKIVFVAMLISTIINIVFYRKEVKSLTMIIKNSFSRKR